MYEIIGNNSLKYENSLPDKHIDSEYVQQLNEIEFTMKSNQISIKLRCVNDKRLFGPVTIHHVLSRNEQNHSLFGTVWIFVEINKH